MGLADKLSRGETRASVNDNKKTLKGERLKERRWNKHAKMENDTQIWVHDNGEKRKISKVEERRAICISEHERLSHRSAECVYQELKRTMYWPGIKATGENAVKDCEICAIYNRKRKQSSESLLLHTNWKGLP